MLLQMSLMQGKPKKLDCDARRSEGFEAGGHNGLTNHNALSCPQVVDAVKIPVIAAGGIADGDKCLRRLALGAQAVQIGTRLQATVEASSHPNYKQAIVDAKDNDTI